LGALLWGGIHVVRLVPSSGTELVLTQDATDGLSQRTGELYERVDEFRLRVADDRGVVRTLGDEQLPVTGCVELRTDGSLRSGMAALRATMDGERAR
jgi:hypothetical protein